MKGIGMEGIINIFFPRRCPVCDDIVRKAEGLVCRACMPRIKYVEGPTCMKCGKMLKSAGLEYCYDCDGKTHIYDRGMALYDYKSISDSIYRFKYKGRREYASFYGEEICKYLGEEIKRLKPDALLPVPIHRKRIRERGYNQAALLAEEMSKGLRIPVMDRLIIRRRRTAPQKDLNERERQNNLKKAFKISQNDVKLNTAIIIDDIYTTGSTIDAVAEELRRAGVLKIYFVALAIGRGI
jgi:ComF family protein